MKLIKGGKEKEEEGNNEKEKKEKKEKKEEQIPLKWLNLKSNTINHNKMPVLGRVPKGVEKKEHKVTTYASLSGLAAEMVEQCPQFKTHADVRRAADYIGVHMLYQKFISPPKQRQEASFGYFCFRHLQLMEKFYLESQLIEFGVEGIKRLFDGNKKGWIPFKKVKQNADKLIKLAPKRIRPDLKAAIEKEFNKHGAILGDKIAKSEKNGES